MLQESVVSWVTAMSGTEDNPLLVRHFEISASYGESQKLHDGSGMQLFCCMCPAIAVLVPAAGSRSARASPALPAAAAILASTMQFLSRWKPFFFPFVMSMLEYFISEITDVYYLLNDLSLQQSLRVITTKTCTTDVKSHQFKSTYTLLKTKPNGFFLIPAFQLLKLR